MHEKGWISLHRKFLEWEWFDDNNMVKLFIYLLLKANHSEATHQGTTIKRGQLKTGLDKLHSETKITIQTLRTCLKRMEKTEEINMQVTNKYRIITICNYDTYQDSQQATNKQTNKQLTSNQQATNKQLTANNNDNKDNNENNDNKLFNEFWDKYHLITGKQKTDKEPTLKHWNKLNDADRRKAIDNIENYTKSLSDKKYCKKARTYLADKNFNDEFEIAVNGQKKYIQYYKYGSPAQYIPIEQWDRFYSMEKEQITSYKEVLR